MLWIISLAFAMLIIVGAVPVQAVEPAVVQAPSVAHTYGTQQCVWQISQPIGSGDIVVGFAHMTQQGDTAEAYQESVTDDAGNQYNLTAHVHWEPYPALRCSTLTSRARRAASTRSRSSATESCLTRQWRIRRRVACICSFRRLNTPKSETLEAPAAAVSDPG